MKIYFDYQMILWQKYGGISRYFCEIYSRMMEKDDCEPFVRCFGSTNYYFDKYFSKNNPILYSIGKKIKIKRASGLINRILTYFDLKRNYDIVHPTYYKPYIIKLCKGKMVITVYDMIAELFSEDFPDEERENKYATIHAADHIIAISESTKRDIIRLFPEIPPEKITVIYIGSDMKKVDDKILREKLPSKYILFVGGRRSYKNFISFVDAMDPILEADSSLQIVCTGGGSFRDEEISRMGNKASRYHQINCDDDMLAAAYMNAECFVFPSKYEGFGIPTLEAFACDCPVVLSNTSSMPEVGGDAVEYCDPNSIESIHDAVVRVLNSPELRAELIRKGREQRKKFDWDEITAQTLECYRKVIEANGTDK